MSFQGENANPSVYLTPEELTNVKGVFQLFTHGGVDAMRKDDLRVALRLLGLEISYQQYLGYCALFTSSSATSMPGADEPSVMMSEVGIGSSSVKEGSLLNESALRSATETPKTKSLAKGAGRGISNTFSLKDFIEVCIDARDSRTEGLRSAGSSNHFRGATSSRFDIGGKAAAAKSSTLTTSVCTSKEKTVREAFNYCDETGEGALTPKALERMLQGLSKSVATCNFSSTGEDGEGLMGAGSLTGLDVPSEADLAGLLRDLGIDPKVGLTEEDLLKILSTSSSII